MRQGDGPRRFAAGSSISARLPTIPRGKRHSSDGLSSVTTVVMATATYVELLTQCKPRLIRSDREHSRALAVVGQLLDFRIAVARANCRARPSADIGCTPNSMRRDSSHGASCSWLELSVGFTVGSRDSPGPPPSTRRRGGSSWRGWVHRRAQPSA